jgi:alkylhydroperoxidase family enzyme
MTDAPARIPRITPEEWTDETHGVFEVLAGPQFDADQTRNHVLTTFAHYPALTKPFLGFNRHVLAGTSLPIRMRQIAIQRVAWIRRCRYMWSSHLRVSLNVGLGREDFEAIKQGVDAPLWTDFERNLVRAVDQLCDKSELDEATWTALGAEFDRRQMMDLLFTVGCYTALTMVFNAIGIEREPELVALANEYGAP